MGDTAMSTKFGRAALIAALMCAAAGAAMAAAAPKFTRNPSLSRNAVAFLHADDIWIAPRAGGTATRLTTGGKARGGPWFSPDGQEIAYTATVGASTDIFVVPVTGGPPQRITWHPDSEGLAGWTPDGRSIVFNSSRASGLRGAPKLFTVRRDGQGAPTVLPLPVGAAIAFSADPAKAAYVPLTARSWKGYRGGRAPYIWLVDLKSLDTVEVPHTEASDWNPLWVGGKVYFLSDRDGPVSLYAFDPATNAVSTALENKGGFDFQSAQAGPGGIIIDAFDGLKLFDPATGAVRTIPVRIPDAEGLGRRKVELPGRRAVISVLSPDGSAFAVEARGDIFVAPSTPGAAARNLTDSTAVADRSPAWSPDGKQVSYVSDASSEYRLVVRAADGSGKPRVFTLGEGHGVFNYFQWSPDGRRLAYADDRTAFLVLDTATGKSSRIAKDLYGQGLELAGWSADGRSLAYVARNRALMGVVWLYSIDSGLSTALTDGRSDAFSPSFDPAGGKVYFLASADRPMGSTGSMASNGVPWSSGAYVADLSGPAPVIERLPAPPREYRSLAAGENGAVYLTEGAQDASRTVWRVAGGKTEAFIGNIQGFDLEVGGKVAMIRRRGETAMVPLADIKPGADGQPGAAPSGTVFTAPTLPMTVDPRAEWKQIYREGWRLQRDLFYASHYNGLDIAKAEARYAPFVAGIDSRSDLTYLMREAFSELRASHMAVADPPRGDPAFGPEAPAGAEPKTAGLLGADYTADTGRYRFARIYRGDIWLTDAIGPLGKPGIAVKEGDYLISVDGHELRADDNLDKAFEGLAGKAVEIRVSTDPLGANARTYKVTPAANEFAYRHAAWIEDNRKKVDRLSDGKLAYVYVINTGEEGYDGFNTQYVSQADKLGLVVDERNNAGGPIADYIVERLKRTPLVQVWPRYAEISQAFPGDYINGPAAMIINESAGSGGDILPHMFRKAKAGPIVGKRSWGGTVGAGGSPSLLDGGNLSIPHWPISDPDGTWGGLEGNGVTPDIVVEQDPKLVAAGRDPQLEAAVKAVLDQLAAKPPVPRTPPPSREAVKGGRGG